MVETLSVSLSGPAFSLLLYENVRTRYDQEGFLLGEIVEKRTNSITDNDEQVTKIDRVIKINSAIPCPKIGYFYDAAGRINRKKILEFLGNPNSKRLKVVAWYKFKHCNAFKMTLREKIVHKALSQHFGSSPELFACCLLTSSSSVDGSTHLYSQTFLRYLEPNYQMLPMHIVNLSDPNNLYRSVEPSSEGFNKLVKSLGIDKNKTQGFSVITQINEELQSRTEQVALKLAEAEKKYYDLQLEVHILQEKLKLKEMEKETNNAMDNSSDFIVFENGSGEDGINVGASGSKEEPLTSIKSNINRGRKKASHKQTTRNSSRSPIKSDINVDNIVNNRVRSRTTTNAQSKN